MAGPFSLAEWKKIRTNLDASPGTYGLPEKRSDSIVIASFNIRKLGNIKERDDATWEFLAHVCRHFDLVAVQEVMNDLSGLRHLVAKMGPDYGFITSDVTGAFPGDPGLEERLAFIFNWKTVQRTDVASDVTYDRTKVLDILARNSQAFHDLLHPHGQKLAQYEKEMADYKAKKRPKPPTKPTLQGQLPTFLTYIRTPFQVGFEVPSKNGGKPYRFVAINAHLNWGDSVADRKQDFEGTMNWLDGHVHDEYAYSPDCILLGDLNMKFDNPKADRPWIDSFIKSYDQEADEGVHVNFPFLDPKQGMTGPYRSNARLDETFDQIGIFARDKRYPTHDANATMTTGHAGPDYGVFDFVHLFSHATEGERYDPKGWKADRRAKFFAKFEHDVSDHMPIWLRLPRP